MAGRSDADRLGSGEWDHFLYVGKFAFFGWFLHYFPFLIMGRVTYLHHYVRLLAPLMADADGGRARSCRRSTLRC